MTLEFFTTKFHRARWKQKQSFTFWYCVDNFYPWKDIVGKKGSKLRSIAELRAFYGTCTMYMYSYLYTGGFISSKYTGQCEAGSPCEKMRTHGPGQPQRVQVSALRAVSPQLSAVCDTALLPICQSAVRPPAIPAAITHPPRLISRIRGTPPPLTHPSPHPI